MIDEIRLSVLFRGEQFSPEEAERISGLVLTSKLEIGDIPKRGRYKGRPVPYGSAQLVAPDDVPDDDKLMWLISALEGKLELLYNCGAEETEIYAGYFYKDQCNFGFTKEELLALAKLHIDFGVSCYDISKDDDD